MLATNQLVWPEYHPSTDSPWNLRRVYHLHRRLGFSATWDELQRDLADGPKAAVDRLLSGGEPVIDFESLQQLIGDAAVGASDINRLKAWWIYRMLYSGDPLTERMTLLWHNHFATSNLKVNDAAMMKQQNERIRQHALGRFNDLLNSVLKDPAMLTWLDAKSNRRGVPNENLARELMELFTVGVGHYDETDVKEVARALTGWTVSKSQFAFVKAEHDDGEKCFLGIKGKFDGDDVLAALLNHQATAKRLARRLCEMFFGEDIVPDEYIDLLAAGLRERDLDLKWGVKAVLRSEAFFDESNIGNRVLDPMCFILGQLRALEMLDPPPSTLLLAEWAGKLGQDLFYPPNVFGWPGGRSWLTTRTMIGRMNFASALVDGRLHRPAKPLDAKALATRHGFDSLKAQRSFFSELILGHGEAPDAIGDGMSLNEFVRSLLASPPAQIC